MSYDFSYSSSSYEPSPEFLSVRDRPEEASNSLIKGFYWSTLVFTLFTMVVCAGSIWTWSAGTFDSGNDHNTAYGFMVFACVTLAFSFIVFVLCCYCLNNSVGFTMAIKRAVRSLESRLGKSDNDFRQNELSDEISRNEDALRQTELELERYRKIA